MKVKYFDTGAVPIYLGYVPDEASWNREMKRLGVKDEPYPASPGRCTKIVNSRQESITLITFNKQPYHTEAQIIGIIAHEAVHAVDFMIEAMGDPSPSEEFRAYNVQMIVQEVYTEYKRLFA